MIIQNLLKMKNKINDTLRNYFNEMIKNVPKLEWKDINKDDTVCSTLTQFGEFTIKKYVYDPGYFCLYLNNYPASINSNDVNVLMNVANLTYKEKIKRALRI